MCAQVVWQAGITIIFLYFLHACILHILSLVSHSRTINFRKSKMCVFPAMCLCVYVCARAHRLGFVPHKLSGVGEGGLWVHLVRSMIGKFRVRGSGGGLGEGVAFCGSPLFA